MKKYGLLLGLAITGFLLGFGSLTKADWAGQNDFQGYFRGHYDYSGDYVFKSGISGVNSVSDFKSFITGKYNDSVQNNVGAVFVINALEGRNAPGIGTEQSNGRITLSDPQLTNFKNLMDNFAGNTVNVDSINGFHHNDNYEVDWNFDFPYDINSMYQDDYNDDAYYSDKDHAPSIVFKIPHFDSGHTYSLVGIKLKCSNVVINSAFPGGTPPPPHFRIYGKTTVQHGDTVYDNGREGGTVPWRVPVGTTLTFRHYLENDGPNTTNHTIDWRTRDYVAQQDIASGQRIGTTDTDGWHQIIGTSPNLGTEWYTTKQSDVGSKICRRVNYEPTSDSDAGWGFNGQPVCVKVTSTPTVSASCTAAKSSPDGRDPDVGTDATVGVKITITGGSVSLADYHVEGSADSPGNSSVSPPSQPLNNGTPQYTDFNVHNPDARAPNNNPVNYTFHIVNNTDSSGVLGTCPASIHWYVPPPVKPYFKVYDGDVFTGGWFENGTTCDMNKYQAPDYGNLGSTRQQGGIYTFASGGIGASGQYAAFSLGEINGEDAPQYGFYTRSDNKNALSFANSSGYISSYSDAWSGLFEGERKQHCVNDYFGTNSTSGATPSATVPDIGVSGKKIYPASGVAPGVVSINPAGAKTIGKNQDTVVYIKGNVYIKNNITYVGADSYGINDAPKFALIVQGDIYIDPGVTQLDGVYIAQPDSSGNGGVIWTCNNGSAGAYDFRAINANCKNQLTFNGAVIAKQMNLWRVDGGLNAGLIDNPGDKVNGPGTPAEIFRYIPAMVLSSPLGDLSPNSTSQDFEVESVISLPPIF